MRVAGLKLAGVLAAACSRTPAPAAGQPPGSAPATSLPGSATAEPITSSPPVLPDGCWAGFSNDVDAAASSLARLEALAQRCASGLTALEPKPTLVELQAGRPQRHEFEVKSGAGCVRVLASGGADSADIGLELVDAQGIVRQRDTLRAPFALVPTFGTACLEPGKYAAVVSIAQGSATIALVAYAAE